MRAGEHHAQAVERQSISLVQSGPDGRSDELRKSAWRVFDDEDQDQQPAADIDPNDLSVEIGNAPRSVDANLPQHLVRATATEILSDEPNNGGVREGHSWIV